MAGEPRGPTLPSAGEIDRRIAAAQWATPLQKIALADRMREALEALVEHAMPVNWDDDEEDPEMTEAWGKAIDVLAGQVELPL
jgi:hypothetical protein